MAVSSSDFSTGEMANLPAFLSAAGFSSPFQVEPIVQEASHRNYFRILFQSGDIRSLVLCRDLPIPDPESHDALRINRYLQERGVSVPRILKVDPLSGWILQSDAGHSDVSDTLRSPGFEPGTERRAILIESVLTLLSEIHALPPEPPVKFRFFDREKLWWEMEFLLARWKELIDSQGTVAHPSSSHSGLIVYLEQLVWNLSRAKPMVYTHRDFHGRNILVGDRESQAGPFLTLVDYQDARMGLPWYDLASFLYDPYSTLTPREREEFYRRYCNMQGYSPEESYPLFRMQAIQRLLKALGSFLFFVYQKEQSKYVPSIPGALNLLLALCTEESDAPLLEFIHDVQRVTHSSPPFTGMEKSRSPGPATRAMRHDPSRRERLDGGHAGG